jgi:phage gpG-like protein
MRSSGSLCRISDTLGLAVAPCHKHPSRFNRLRRKILPSLPSAAALRLWQVAAPPSAMLHRRRGWGRVHGAVQATPRARRARHARPDRANDWALHGTDRAFAEVRRSGAKATCNNKCSISPPLIRAIASPSRNATQQTAVTSWLRGRPVRSHRPRHPGK